MGNKDSAITISSRSPYFDFIEDGIDQNSVIKYGQVNQD